MDFYIMKDLDPEGILILQLSSTAEGHIQRCQNPDTQYIMVLFFSCRKKKLMLFAAVVVDAGVCVLSH